MIDPKLTVGTPLGDARYKALLLRAVCRVLLAVDALAQCTPGYLEDLLGRFADDLGVIADLIEVAVGEAA